MSIENIEEASKICNFITSNLYPRSGVYFSNKQLIIIIIEETENFLIKMNDLFNKLNIDYYYLQKNTNHMMRKMNAKSEIL